MKMAYSCPGRQLIADLPLDNKGFQQITTPYFFRDGGSIFGDYLPVGV